MSEDTRWPAGHPDEARIRAEIAHSLEEIPCSPTISRGDLESLDQIITVLDSLCDNGFTTDLYDDMWNLRNHLVPFVPGDEHYDEGIED